MISNIVYLYGDKFAPETNIFHFREELFNGKKVDQKKLAQQLILAAILSLYQDKIIDLFIEERKVLFIKTKTAKAKKLKDANGLQGLEKEVFGHVKDIASIKDMVMHSIYVDENPWEEITKIVKKQLKEEKAKYKEEEIEKMFNAYSATIKEIKSKDELFSKLQEAIKEGIEAREEKEESSKNE